MTERECTCKIIAFVDEKRIVIDCDPEKGCLNDLVWSGIGVIGAAAKMLQIEKTDEIDAYVQGDCKRLIVNN